MLFSSLAMAQNDDNKAWQQLRAKEGMVIAYFKKNGERSYARSESMYYRKLLKVNKTDSYQIQDFYTKNNIKQINPIILTDVKDAYSWNPKSIQGKITYWRNDGSKDAEATYLQGKLDGIYQTWYSSGPLRSESFYKEDKLQGRYTFWYETGEKQEESFYVDGDLQGSYKEWYQSGQLSYEANYENDYESGTVNYWYKDGQLEEQYIRLNGKLEGIYKTWHENGQLASEKNYKEGKIVGEEKGWDKQGKLLYTHHYKNGHILWPQKL